MANKCKECGCSCKKCVSDHDVQLHLEIENLKQRLLEKENHIVMMETNFLNEANKFPTGEMGALKEELLTWQDKYKRLYEAHRRVQRVNQGLEDKLLKLVDVCETDKNTLTRDVATLSHNLAEANYAIKKLTEDNERYKNDVSLAIQFLQCKQTNFVAHRFDSLPSEVQTQVAAYMNSKRKPYEEKTRTPLEPKSIKVPIPTFPPTAMVYSVPKSPKESDNKRQEEDDPEQPQVDIVSAAIMAKVLEERQKERALAKHCDTCTCAKNLKIIYEVSHHHVGTQTGNDYKENVCLKCNDIIAQPLSGGIQILKPSDDKSKRSSPYPNLVVSLPLEATQNLQQNIVKVQPNNFLIEKALSLSNPSEECDTHRIDIQEPPSELRDNRLAFAGDSPKLSNTTVSMVMVEETRIPSSGPAKDLIDFNDVTITTVNEKPAVHHKLCDQTAPSFTVEQEEKRDVEKRVSPSDVANPTEFSPKTAENLKGPRYASMRLQTGSKNILLDNAHSNVAPVLYTRTHNHNKTNRQHNSSQTTHKRVESSRKQHDSSSVSSYESKHMSVVSENSTQHQQRIDDWVQVTVENDNISSPDNSRAEDLKLDPKKEMEIKLDKARYAEMEENVKRFLFGESDFWKTVEIGKLKYKSYQEGEKTKVKSSREGSRTSSHTETEI